MTENRKKGLILAVLILAGIKIVWYFYANWGLITLHVQKQPLRVVLNQIQRQGHVLLRTNLDPGTLVTMDVDKVPVSDALETLSVVTESRWRLNYFLAPDVTTLRNGIEAIVSGQKPEDWKIYYYPSPQQILPASGIIPDPRRDRWPTKVPEANLLQSHLDGAAKLVHAGFALPVQWNPTLISAVSSGPVSKVLPKLAGKVSGKSAELFLLLKVERRQGGWREGSDDAGRPGRNFEALNERAEAEIANLPTDEQAAAKAEWERRQALFKELRDLPPEQRREKMQELFNNDPQMQNQQNQRDNRSTPEQKSQRAQSYVDRKQSLLHPQ